MNERKKLLYAHGLSSDVIREIGLDYASEDTQWMVRNGYQTPFRHSGNTLKEIIRNFGGGDITPKGEKFFSQREEESKKLESITLNEQTSRRKRKTYSDIQAYVKKHRRHMDFISNESKAYLGMKEYEIYAFKYFARDPRDCGKC